MRKAFYYAATLLFGISTLNSCMGNGKKNEADEDSTKINVITIDSIATPKLIDEVCIVGDGTTMNVLELIREKGDTVYVECSSDMVTGGVNVGDKVDVAYITTNLDARIVTCVNMTSLQHLWTQIASDGHKQSLEIDESGLASTYNMNIDYDRWSLNGGKLILHSPKQIASEAPAVCDTFDIMHLDDERLVLMHGVIETAFYRDN